MGMPAKQVTRWMAPALPVFAGEPAPTTACAGVSMPVSSHPGTVMPRRGRLIDYKRLRDYPVHCDPCMYSTSPKPPCSFWTCPGCNKPRSRPPFCAWT
ncbi:hypothetical protein GEV41_20635 [Pseudomonas putida]|nr:hypothetical protein CQW32_04120 [Pseudomonas putida]QKL08712.1 hypothetical protein GEV41_20635 [Pseudomonas putida]